MEITGSVARLLAEEYQLLTEQFQATADHWKSLAETHRPDEVIEDFH